MQKRHEGSSFTVKKVAVELAGYELVSLAGLMSLAWSHQTLKNDFTNKLMQNGVVGF